MKKVILIILGVLAVFTGIRLFVVNSSLNSQIRLIQAEKGQLLEKVETLEKRNKELMSEVSELSDLVVLKDNDISSLKQQKNKLIKQIANIKPTTDTVQTFITLNELNDSIIVEYERLDALKDKIILDQKAVIQNDAEIIYSLKGKVVDQEAIIEENQKRIKKLVNKKIFWETTTAVAVGGIIVLLVI